MQSIDNNDGKKCQTVTVVKFFDGIIILDFQLEFYIIQQQLLYKTDIKDA